jgi:hypothetical protein
MNSIKKLIIALVLPCTLGAATLSTGCVVRTRPGTVHTKNHNHKHANKHKHEHCHHKGQGKKVCHSHQHEEPGHH